MKKQCVKKYQVNPGGYHAIDIIPKIEEKLKKDIGFLTKITLKIKWFY